MYKRQALALVGYNTFIPIFQALAWGFAGALNLTLSMLFWGLIIVIVVSLLGAFGGMHISHPAITLIQQLIYPVMAPIQRLLPPMGGLDFSPLIIFLIINVLQIALSGLAASMGLAPSVVVGF